MSDKDYLVPLTDAAITADEILSDWLEASGTPEGAPIETLPAVEDVLMERRRQIIEKGRTTDQDDLYAGVQLPDGQHAGPLALAAAAYACAAACRFYAASDLYPEGWRPPSGIHDARTRLVRAGALILAEIERLDRAAASPPPTVQHTEETA